MRHGTSESPENFYKIFAKILYVERIHGELSIAMAMITNLFDEITEIICSVSIVRLVNAPTLLKICYINNNKYIDENYCIMSVRNV